MTDQEVLSSPEGRFAVSDWLFTYRRQFATLAVPLAAETPGLHRYIHCSGFWFQAAFRSTIICSTEYEGSDWVNSARTLLNGIRAMFDDYRQMPSPDVEQVLDDFAAVLAELFIESRSPNAFELIRKDARFGIRLHKRLNEMGVSELKIFKEESQ